MQKITNLFMVLSLCTFLSACGGSNQSSIGGSQPNGGGSSSNPISSGTNEPPSFSSFEEFKQHVANGKFVKRGHQHEEYHYSNYECESDQKWYGTVTSCDSNNDTFKRVVKIENGSEQVTHELGNSAGSVVAELNAILADAVDGQQIYNANWGKVTGYKVLTSDGETYDIDLGYPVIVNPVSSYDQATEDGYSYSHYYHNNVQY